MVTSRMSKRHHILGRWGWHLCEDGGIHRGFAVGRERGCEAALNQVTADFLPKNLSG